MLSKVDIGPTRTVLRVPGPEVKIMLNWIRSTWCKSMHNEAMWPMHGKYICPRCLREYPVAWEGPVKTTEYADVSLRHAPEATAYATEQRLSA